MAEDSNGFELLKRKLAMKGRLFTQLKSAFRKAGAEHDRAMQARLRGGGTLKRRTGGLARAVGWRVDGDQVDNLTLTVYVAGRKDAKAHEYGARIRPVRSKYLTIPGPDNLTAAGVAREPSMRAFIERTKGFGTLRIFPSLRKQGTLLAVFFPNALQRKLATGADLKRVNRGRKSNVGGQLMWILKKQVTLPGPSTTGAASRLGFHDTWKGNVEQRMARHREAVAVALGARAEVAS